MKQRLLFICISLLIGLFLGAGVWGLFHTFELPRAPSKRAKLSFATGALVCLCTGASLVAWHRLQLAERERQVDEDHRQSLRKPCRSRQPPPFLFAAAVGRLLPLGFIRAHPPAAAAQQSVGPLDTDASNRPRV